MRVISPEYFELFNPKKSLPAVEYVINFFDHIQRGMNPNADPNRWPLCIRTHRNLENLRDKLESMGFLLDYPFQHYKDQVLSGHKFFDDGHQLHVRVFPTKGGDYGIKAHYEWNAEYHPFRHLACSDLSYPKGCRMFKKLWKETL